MSFKVSKDKDGPASITPGFYVVPISGSHFSTPQESLEYGNYFEVTVRFNSEQERSKRIFFDPNDEDTYWKWRMVWKAAGVKPRDAGENNIYEEADLINQMVKVLIYKNDEGYDRIWNLLPPDATPQAEQKSFDKLEKYLHGEKVFTPSYDGNGNGSLSSLDVGF